VRLTSEQCKAQRHATAPGMAGYRQVTDLLDTIDALTTERNNWKDIAGQAHDACEELKTERDAARGEALRDATDEDHREFHRALGFPCDGSNSMAICRRAEEYRLAALSASGQTPSRKLDLVGGRHEEGVQIDVDALGQARVKE
jgi:hypothetical protein